MNAEAWKVLTTSRNCWQHFGYREEVENAIHRFCQAWVKFPNSDDLWLLERKFLNGEIGFSQLNDILDAETVEPPKDFNLAEEHVIQLPNGKVFIQYATVPLIKTDMLRVELKRTDKGLYCNMSCFLWKSMRDSSNSAIPLYINRPYMTYLFSIEQVTEYQLKLIQGALTPEFVMDMLKHPGPEYEYAGDRMWIESDGCCDLVRAEQ